MNYKWETFEEYNIVTLEVDGITNWYWRKDDFGGFVYPAKDWYTIRDAVLRHTPNRDIIVQAGGCCGMYPRLWNKYFRIVHTFEPVDHNFKALCKNCPSDNIHKHNCALGGSNQPVRLFGGEEMTPTGEIKKNVGMYHVMNEKFETGVYQLMLDQLQLIKLDAIQLDVEKYEINVLKGAAETIKRYSPTICVETFDSEVKQFLQNLGYKIAEQVYTDERENGTTIMVRQ